MRYTTIIDVTEMEAVWRNHNASRLYLYMALRCGYHDDDRDKLQLSIRTLAYRTGISLSACRHALKLLQAHGLVSPMGDHWRVTKFVLEKKPTARTQRNTAASADLQNPVELERIQREKTINERVNMCSKEELQKWVAELESGVSLEHYGLTLPATDAWIKWMKNKLRKK